MSARRRIRIGTRQLKKKHSWRRVRLAHYTSWYIIDRNNPGGSGRSAPALGRGRWPSVRFKHQRSIGGGNGGRQAFPPNALTSTVDSLGEVLARPDRAPPQHAGSGPI